MNNNDSNSSINVLLLSTFDKKGGAAIGAFRLLKALRKKGINARMLVQEKVSKDPDIVSLSDTGVSFLSGKLRFFAERLVIYFHNRFSRKKLFQVSIGNTGTAFYNHPWFKQADIIHFQWVHHGFVSLKGLKKTLQSDKHVVWTMRDMWLSTSICHYTYSCDKFKTECQSCPFLNSSMHKDLSYRTWKKKLFINKSGLNIVTLSSWLEGQVQKSAITKGLKTFVIPNMTDTSVFRSSDQSEARQKWNLPLNKKIIIMGAVKLNDPIKGFYYLNKALSILKEGIQDIEYYLLIFGQIKNDERFLQQIPIEYKYVGVVDDEKDIASLYAASDVAVVPSLYETFGKVITEALACGKPVVSFNNSGQTDIIDHKINGYLAEFKNESDLAAGIHWVLKEADYDGLCFNAKSKIESTFTEDIVANKYIDVYLSLKKSFKKV